MAPGAFFCVGHHSYIIRPSLSSRKYLSHRRCFRQLSIICELFVSGAEAPLRPLVGFLVRSPWSLRRTIGGIKRQRKPFLSLPLPALLRCPSVKLWQIFVRHVNLRLFSNDDLHLIPNLENQRSLHVILDWFLTFFSSIMGMFFGAYLAVIDANHSNAVNREA